MLAWFFTTVWHALFGLVLLGGGLVGAVIILCRAVAKGVDHDRARCECAECTTIRYRAYDQRIQAENKQNPSSQSKWLSTRELKVGHRVVSKSDTVYRVDGIIPLHDNVQVHLVNTITLRRTMVEVEWSRMGQPMWKRVH